MMDVKETSTGGAASITSMLGRAAIAKNHELKDVMEKPIQEELKKVSKADKLSKESSDATTDEGNSQPAPTTGKLVDVNV